MPVVGVQVIGVVQLRGGTGRSTLATNIAGVLAQRYTVTLIDAVPPQFASTSWVMMRDELGRADNISVVLVDGHEALLDEVRAPVTDYVVLDAPPRAREVTQAILATSSLLLVPLRPTAEALAGAGEIIDTVVAAQRRRRGLQARIVWTPFRPHVRSEVEFRRAAEATLPIPALRTALGKRVAYQKALDRGLTVAEIRDKKARAELEGLMRDIRRLI